MVAPLRYVASTLPLRMSEVRTLAPVRARNIALSLAGRARTIYELATGSDAGNDGGGSPINPQGRLGTDLSGPPFGPCIRQSLCVVEGLATVSNIVGEQPIYTFSEDQEWFNLFMRVYVRPHVNQRGDEPLARGYLSVKYIGTGAGTGTANAYFWSDSEYDVYSRLPPAALSASNASEQEDVTLWAPLKPGINKVQVSFQSTSTTNLIKILRLSINQIVTQEH